MCGPGCSCHILVFPLVNLKRFQNEKEEQKKNSTKTNPERDRLFDCNNVQKLVKALNKKYMNPIELLCQERRT